jgi:hypothetical protein
MRDIKVYPGLTVRSATGLIPKATFSIGTSVSSFGRMSPVMVLCATQPSPTRAGSNAPRSTRAQNVSRQQARN